MALIPRIALSLLALLSTAPALAQIQLNLVVHDHDGHPVQHLTASDFHLNAGGQPVPITRVDEHTATTPAPPIQPLPLPPGTFADVTPLAPSDTLNIVVFDALNTPPEAQAALRAQLRQLAEHPTPTSHLALFGLTSHLILLQDFTSDPTVLKDAVEHKLIPRGQALLDTTHNLTQTTAAQQDLQLMQLAANLHLFESTATSLDRQLRQQYTLDALHALALYLTSLPGHKNVLWLAPSFPVTFNAQPTTPELTQTAELLNAAGASLYPIDTRSLLTSPRAAHPLKFFDSAEAEETAMHQLALSTGGVAILNPTSLSSAISRAAQLGSAYYTLTLPDDALTHPLHLTLSAPSAADATLIYPHSPPLPLPSETDQLDALHAAMARGAPAPQDIPFKVRVLPATTAPEPTIAPGNQQDPSYKVPGPWQRYEIDFIALASAFTLHPAPGNAHTGKLGALAYVYDIDGRILNTEGNTISLTLTPTEYGPFRSSAIKIHLEVSVPLRQLSYLRLSLRDALSGRIGTVELPVSAVSHLTPIEPTPQPPAAPAH